MAFDLDLWKRQVQERLHEWRPRMQAAGVKSAYAFVAAAALWPVAQAAQQGNWAALAALGGVLAGVGGNLLANQLQGWKDEADAARQVAGSLEDAQVRQEVETVLAKLDALAQARAALPVHERPWFDGEMTLAQSSVSYHASVTGSGAVAQGPGAAAAGQGGVAVAGSVYGGIVMGGPASDSVEAKAFARMTPADEIASLHTQIDAHKRLALALAQERVLAGAAEAARLDVQISQERQEIKRLEDRLDAISQR